MKFLSFFMTGVILIVAPATINIQGAQASKGAEFVQVSVLSEHQANYGVDENVSTFTAISMDIVEDKIKDDAQTGRGSGKKDAVVTELRSNQKKAENNNNSGIADNGNQAAPSQISSTIIQSGVTSGQSITLPGLNVIAPVQSSDTPEQGSSASSAIANIIDQSGVAPDNGTNTSNIEDITIPGQSNATPVLSKDTPGQSGNTPGKSGNTPGQSGNTPEQGGAPPGLSGATPGQSDSTPGKNGTAPGKRADTSEINDNPAPGQSENAPGQGGTSPGQSGNAPGQGGSSPGQSGDTPDGGSDNGNSNAGGNGNGNAGGNGKGNGHNK